MKTIEKKMIRSSMLVVLAVLVMVVCLQAVVSPARGDSMSLQSIGALPASNTIAPADFTDWVLGNGNRMAKGSQISVLSTGNLPGRELPHVHLLQRDFSRFRSKRIGDVPLGRRQ